MLQELIYFNMCRPQMVIKLKNSKTHYYDAVSDNKTRKILIQDCDSDW